MANLPVVRRRAPAIVVREPAKRRIRPLDRLACWFCCCILVPSELRRPSACICSENTDVDMVDAVESPRRLPPIKVPPLDDVFVADESLRENIECPNDDNLSFDSISDFCCSSFRGARRRVQRIDRRNANIKKNVAIISQPRWLLKCTLCFVLFVSAFAFSLCLFAGSFFVHNYTFNVYFIGDWFMYLFLLLVLVLTLFCTLCCLILFLKQIRFGFKIKWFKIIANIFYELK